MSVPAHRRAALLGAALALGACQNLMEPVDLSPRIPVLDKPDAVVEAAVPIQSEDGKHRGAFYGRVPDGVTSRVIEVTLELWTDNNGNGVHDENENLTRSSYATSEGLATFRLPYDIRVAPPTPLAGTLTVSTLEATYEIPLLLPTGAQARATSGSD